MKRPVCPARSFRIAFACDSYAELRLQPHLQRRRGFTSRSLCLLCPCLGGTAGRDQRFQNRWVSGGRRRVAPEQRPPRPWRLPPPPLPFPAGENGRAGRSGHQGSLPPGTAATNLARMAKEDGQKAKEDGEGLPLGNGVLPWPSSLPHEPHRLRPGDEGEISGRGCC